jgi:hypothetical protein
MRRLLLLAAVVASFGSVIMSGCILSTGGHSPTPPDNNTTTGTDKHGTISGTETWDGTTAYHITSDLNIEAPVTWSRKITVDVDPNVTISVQSSGSLTIEEGVTVRLGTGAYFEVGYTSAGTFIAQGSDSLPISLLPATGVQNWGYAGGDYSGGIRLMDYTTSTSTITHCIIQSATTGIYVGKGNYPISYCKITGGSLYGIAFDTDAGPRDSASFLKDTITGCASYPIRMPAAAMVKLSGTGTFSGNTKDGILIYNGANVNASGTWKKHDVPYIIDDCVSIGAAAGATITVQPGVICKFESGAYIEIGYTSSAAFVAQGLDTLPITFAANANVQNWGYDNGDRSGGIWIGDYATATTSLKHCVIKSATSGIFVGKGAFPISYCTIDSSKLYGIAFDVDAGPKDSASFLNDTITNSGSYPVRIPARELVKLSGTGKFSGNAKDAIYVYNGQNVDQSGTWEKLDVPYVIDATVDIGSATGVTITVRPKIEFMFETDAYLNIGYTKSATFIAQGTAQDSIFFLNNVAAGTWGYDNGTRSGGLWFGSYATALNSLKYCSIKNASSGVFVETGAKIEMSNCLVKGSKFSGINFNGSPKDSASFLDNTITGNTEYAIRIGANDLIKLSGTGTVAGNTLDGIYVEGENVKVSGLWKKHDAPYLVNGTLDVSNVTGVTITIQPGANFELVADAYLEVGYGNTGAVIANGTTADPITFTQHSSGVYWGYDNGDRSGGVWIGDHAATTTSFTYCTIEKATTGVFVDAAVTVKNCTITDNQYYGMVQSTHASAALLTPNTYLRNGTQDVYVP